MKSDEERGQFAAWLRRERLAHDWKEAEARRRLESAAATGVSFSSYRDMEAGNRKPTPGQQAAIVKVFGEPPSAGSGDGISSDSAALIAAIRSLVEEMRLSRAQQDESTRALLEAVAAVVHGDRGQPETSDDTEHEAHAGTGR